MKNCILLLWNIHSHGISVRSMKSLRRRMQRDVNLAHRHPTTYLPIIQGDFNMRSKGEGSLRLDDPHAATLQASQESDTSDSASTSSASTSEGTPPEENESGLVLSSPPIERPNDIDDLPCLVSDDDSEGHLFENDSDSDSDDDNDSLYDYDMTVARSMGRTMCIIVTCSITIIMARRGR